MDPRTIVVLEGDQTGQELLEAAVRVLQPDVLGIEPTASCTSQRARSPPTASA